MNLAPINEKKEFEHFCKWVARDNFGPNVFLYSKYSQNGIDIYWNEMGKYAVIQCKQRSNPNPSELIYSLEKDFEKAQMHFNTDLGNFIFATTASLKILETKVNRQNGLMESLLDVCSRLSNQYNVNVIAWHWDYLEERVLESPFLLKYLLHRQEGADLINNHFIKKHSSPFIDIEEKLCKLEYYGGQEEIQWYGILKNFDAPRKIYDAVLEKITLSFEKNDPIAIVIRGDGGSGKSVFLRRIAVDLREKYTVYWLSNNIEAFINNEFIYDVQRHPNSKFVIILDDWYRTIERIGNKTVANQLLYAIKKTSNARLIIGDRKNDRKIYDDFVDLNHVHDFHNTENLEALQNVFERMPEWKESLSENEIRNISSTTLFIALFVFCYGEHNDKEKLVTRYKNVYKSDYNKFLERDDPFEKNIAICLYIYANIYSIYGITLTVVSFIELVCFYGNCSIPKRYQNNINNLFQFPFLKKYLHIEKVIHPAGTVSKLVFHHDTMAELGWSSKHNLVEIEFNKEIIDDIIFILTKSDQIFDLGLICRSFSIQHEEFSRVIGRQYLSLEKAYENPMAFSHFLKILRKENIAREKTEEFLKTDKPYLYEQVFCKAIELHKDKTIAKTKIEEFLKIDKPYLYEQVFCKTIELFKDSKMAKEKSEEYLRTDKPYFCEQVFCIAIKLLKDKKIVKKKAEEFLRTDKPYLYEQVFCKAIDLLRGSSLAKEKAEEFLRTDTPYRNEQVFCKAIELLRGSSIAKEKAMGFLKIDKPYTFQQSFVKSLDILKDDKIAKEKAEECLKNNEPYLYRAAFLKSIKFLDKK